MDYVKKKAITCILFIISLARRGVLMLMLISLVFDANPEILTYVLAVNHDVRGVGS